uniref:Ig-like domain-containing protein n=1 Tax=Sander lucioperca TaxID=283035 RepID=A0A8C9X9D2_SANLU
MEKLTGFLLLFAALNFALAQEVTTKFFTDGEELTMDLRPPPPGPLSEILWKSDNNLVAEWVKDVVPVTYYRNFRGRTTLDVTTGRLVIKDMTEAEMGVYSVEVNRKPHNKYYYAIWLRELPEPEVEAPFITLTCDADITDAGPVTYSWKKGYGEWKESGKDLDITKLETAHDHTFACRIKNPVSERESKPMNQWFSNFFNNVPPVKYSLCQVAPDHTLNCPVAEMCFRNKILLPCLVQHCGTDIHMSTINEQDW